MGKYFNQVKGKDRYNRNLYMCRYCEKIYQKAGIGRHACGKEHKSNLERFGDTPPIADTHPKKVAQPKVITPSMKLQKFI